MCIKRRILTEYVVLDIETTGFNPQKHKIIEIAVCKVKDGNIIDEYTTFVYTSCNNRDYRDNRKYANRSRNNR